MRLENFRAMNLPESRSTATITTTAIMHFRHYTKLLLTRTALIGMETLQQVLQTATEPSSTSAVKMLRLQLQH